MEATMKMLVFLLMPLLLVQPSVSSPTPPKLSGYHFRITTVSNGNYSTITRNETTGELSYSGYYVDILRELSKEDRANFTYELLPPSGFGSGCGPNRLNYNDSRDADKAYSIDFQAGFTCAESDVNDRPMTNYTTDMYIGMFFITPDRQRTNQFTIPLDPPGTGALTLLGPLTNVEGITELLFHRPEIPVCGYAATAYSQLLKTSFPRLNLHLLSHPNETYPALESGLCEATIVPAPGTKFYLWDFYNNNRCQANGRPIGVIGKPLGFGLKHFAFAGIRDDIETQVVRTIDFWLQALMTCFPQDPSGYCYTENGGGSLQELYAQYEDLDSSGEECGYVQYPQDPDKISPGSLAAIVVCPVLFVIIVAVLVHAHRMKVQERRTKKRFVQQIARNIEISPNVRNIQAEKLSELFCHIGGDDGLISKEDLAKWMNDLNMEFMSERDFERLWSLLDIDNTGNVDPIDFISFLKFCAPQFEEVHNEFSRLPKSERIKLASRRLSNISTMGEEGVLRMERRNNKRNREVVLGPRTASKITGMDNYSEHSRENESRRSNFGKLLGFRSTKSLRGDKDKF